MDDAACEAKHKKLSSLPPLKLSLDNPAGVLWASSVRGAVDESPRPRIPWGAMP